MIDRVDENDNVIGATTKEEAHRQGHIHRVAAVYVLDADGKLLVQLRKKDGLLDHSAAGHVDQGESYDDAARRELMEELGIQREQLGLIGHFLSDERKREGYNIVHYFKVYETTLHDDIMRLEPREVVKMVSMTIPDIVRAMQETPKQFTQGFMNALNFYNAKKGLGFPRVVVK